MPQVRVYTSNIPRNEARKKYSIRHSKEEEVNRKTTQAVIKAFVGTKSAKSGQHVLKKIINKYTLGISTSLKKPQEPMTPKQKSCMASMHNSIFPRSKKCK